ncbi:BACON domain-containing protein [Bacteroides ovatus]|uniref:BACON domain-containing protein n=1 Tax=Bacteroides ovatus TaxID=28116 RepID=UPI001898CEC9|nr:BACON domain-containing protein [Bacteroides ovatus]MDC2610172.1 BACON domain-containing protein [Bacteroides ovatus]
MDKDFITVSPSGGGQGVTKLSVQAAINEGGSRSTFITITGGGITRTIPISQEASPLKLIVVGASGNIIKTTIT